MNPGKLEISRLVDFLQTTEGTVRVAVAVAVVKKSLHLFSSFLEGLSEKDVEAIHVSYFKQGDSFYFRYIRNIKEQNLDKNPCPGEGGCRFLFNRARLRADLYTDFHRMA